MPSGQLSTSPMPWYRSALVKLGACRFRVCNRMRKCTAVLGGAGPPDSQGDPNVQEGLVQMVRLQIGKEKVKESVEEEKLKLQQLAEEV